jgi:hypothetical protein
MIIQITQKEKKFLVELFRCLKPYKNVRLRTMNNGFKIYFDGGKIKLLQIHKRDRENFSIRIIKNIPCYLNPVKLLKCLKDIKETCFLDLKRNAVRDDTN